MAGKREGLRTEVAWGGTTLFGNQDGPKKSTQTVVCHA